MAFNSLAFEELKTRANGMIVIVTLLDVRVTGSQMGRQEAKARVMQIEPNADSALVSRHAPQTGFSRCGLYIADRPKERRLDEYNECSSYELF